MTAARAARVSAFAGAILLTAGLFVAPRDVALSYLVAYTATLAVAVGMLLLVMIAYLSGAVWFVVLRRRAEAVLDALPALAVLTLPLVIVPWAFWPWAATSNTGYFHPAFFTGRAITYWIAWLIPAEWLRRVSREQDAGADVSARLGIICAAGIPAVALALTFASVDWMMSISPGWSSSVYGPYYFAGAMVSALAMLAILARRAAMRGGAWPPTTEHFQALGRLTLAFVLFWAYLWYAQFFIVWIGDIPREAAWLLARLRDGWSMLAALVVVGGFVVPFVVLAFRGARGSGVVMSSLGVWLLALHYVDIYWLLAPEARPRWSVVDAVWDLGALAFVVGSAVALSSWRHVSATAEVPVGDPLLTSSIRYEAH